jgi:hypothetical protein
MPAAQNVKLQGDDRPLKRKAHGDLDSCKDYEAKKRKRLFQTTWLCTYPWLSYDKEADVMHCGVCRAFPQLADQTNRLVAGSNNFRKGPLDVHAACKSHLQCIQAKAARDRPQQTPMAVLKRRMTQGQMQTISALVNSAFSVASNNFSLRDYDKLCRLQVKNGVDLGRNYHNHHGVKDFIGSIAHVQRQETVQGISQSRFISVKADGGTDKGVTEQESVFVLYIRLSLSLWAYRSWMMLQLLGFSRL